MNGHFSAVGDAPAAQQYEHGVQVIDEDKQYKSVFSPNTLRNPVFFHPRASTAAAAALLAVSRAPSEKLILTAKTAPI